MQRPTVRTTRRGVLAAIAAVAAAGATTRGAQATATGPSIRLVEPVERTESNGTLLIPRTQPLRIAFQPSPGARIDLRTLKLEAGLSTRLGFLPAVDLRKGMEPLLASGGAFLSEDGLYLPRGFHGVENLPDSGDIRASIKDTTGRSGTIGPLSVRLI